jgi:hypothetical protein
MIAAGGSDGRDGPPPGPSGGDSATLTEITTTASSQFDAAAAAGDVPAMVTAILDLEAAISDWAADTEEDQGTDQSRAVLRGLIGRLGEIAAAAAADDPGQRLAAVAGPLLRLRSDLRGQGLYPAADTIRDALTAAGLVIQDTADGTRWAQPGRLPRRQSLSGHGSGAVAAAGTGDGRDGQLGSGTAETVVAGLVQCRADLVAGQWPGAGDRHEGKAVRNEVDRHGLDAVEGA